MNKIIKKAISALLIIPVLALSVVALSPLVAPANAQSPIQSGIDSAKGAGTADKLLGEGSVFTNVINILLIAIGLISVVMIIIGGIRYAVSGGESGAVTSAKNTILYAVVGLVVAFLAYALVNWVLSGITGDATTT